MGESTVSDTFGSLNRSHNQLSVVPYGNNDHQKMEIPNRKIQKLVYEMNKTLVICMISTLQQHII